MPGMHALHSLVFIAGLWCLPCLADDKATCSTDGPIQAEVGEHRQKNRATTLIGDSGAGRGSVGDDSQVMRQSATHSFDSSLVHVADDQSREAMQHGANRSFNGSLVEVGAGESWEVQLWDISCNNPDLGPFTGLATTYGCAEQAKQEGRQRDLWNCALCDVTLSSVSSGIFTSASCRAKVQCSASRHGVNDWDFREREEAERACKKGNGELLKINGLNRFKQDRIDHPDGACRPCPEGCVACYFEPHWFTPDKFRCEMKALDNTPNGYMCGDDWTTCKGAVCHDANNKNRVCHFIEHHTGTKTHLEKPQYMLTLHSDPKKATGVPEDVETILGEPEAATDLATNTKIEIRGVSCYEPVLSPFSGMTQACRTRIFDRGQSRLTDFNCGLCDIQAKITNGECANTSVSVQCAKGPSRKDMCVPGHGKLGKVAEADDLRNEVCLPCPDNCTIGCSKRIPEGYYTSKGILTTNPFLPGGDSPFFKCQVEQPKDSRNNCFAEMARTLPGYNCSDWCRNRKCKLDPTCSKHDFNAVCKKVGPFNPDPAAAALKNDFAGKEKRSYTITIRGRAASGGAGILSPAVLKLLD